MRTLLIPASCGLLLGMSLSAARLISPDELRDTLRFRPSHALKAALWALGTAIAAMALLCWLALMLLGLLMPSGVRWTRQIPPEKPTESAEPETFVALLPGEEPMVVEIPPEDAEIDDELHHLPPEDEVEEIDGSPEEENPDEPTGILPNEENMETETLEIDDELHHLPPEDEVEEID